MIRIRWTTWRHDLLVGVLASLATTSVLVPISWAAVSDHREQAEVARRMAQAAALLAEQKAAEADQQRAQAQRNLVDQAANFAVGDKSQAEVFRVTTDAITPEIPQDAYVLIDKKASSFAVGDIVIYRVAGNNFLGRVVAEEKAAGRLTIGRNGEAHRQVAVGDVLGRGVLNTR